MKILFLDIDGVLNDHGKLAKSVYCGIVGLTAKDADDLIDILQSGSKK